MSFGKTEFLSIVPHVFQSVGLTQIQALFHDWALDGKPLPPEYRITDDWVWREGRWQVVSRVSEPAHDGPAFFTTAND